ncbi:MAG: polyhydroxyalkanoate biosynthesis repressor PhaR [Candidatus Marinimicrobia bacterium]|nr:polyhydroxyalkanoate biosynthesis repressor PhaR [Candidatus Neomarinimicrobiota bacterium]
MIKFKLDRITLSEKHTPVIIAELGINHNGSLDKAIYLAEKAIEAGAEVLKHQTHIPDEEMSEEAKEIIPLNANRSIYHVIKECALSEKDEFKLMKFIKAKKKIFISTPFSKEAADRLNRFGVPAFKIGSGECNNYDFVRYLTKFKKPIIMSTGMNDIKSIYKSVNIILKKKISLALLHCTNIYPTPDKLIRLNCITELKKAFPSCLVGLSDHSQSIYPCLASISLGARIIEKHFVVNKNKGRGPDFSSSMDFNELKQLIKGSKSIFNSLGKGKKIISDEKSTAKFAFASVVAKYQIEYGEKITEKNICLKRPGNGDFSVNDLKKILGKSAKRQILKNYQLKKKDLN